jgi:hypothetical protein
MKRNGAHVYIIADVVFLREILEFVFFYDFLCIVEKKMYVVVEQKVGFFEGTSLKLYVFQTKEEAEGFMQKLKPQEDDVSEDGYRTYIRMAKFENQLHGETRRVLPTCELHNGSSDCLAFSTKLT